MLAASTVIRSIGTISNLSEPPLPGGLAPTAHSPLKWTARLARLVHLSDEVPLHTRFVGGLTQGLMSIAAALIAYLPTRPLGLREGFWASITAIAVVQMELRATQSSARDQFAGAAIGGLVSAFIDSLWGQHLVTYAAAVILSMLVCWLFNVSSAARLSGSTATILLLVPHQGSPGWMMLSRISEVGWGVAVGIATVWLVNRIEGLVRHRPPPPG